MMYEEFIRNGAKGVVSQEAYKKVEDVYCAYNRFDSKRDIAVFWNEHGEDGIDALEKPLEEVREWKRKSNDIDKQIKEMERQLAALWEQKDKCKKEQKAIALQCDLSWHWVESAA